MNIRAKIFGDKTEDPAAMLPTKNPKGAQADSLHSVSVAREENRRGNTRGEDRHRLSDEQAFVSHNGERSPVQLINVSGGGAMVAGGFEPMLWDRVDLHLGEGGVIECVVRWLRGERVGLEFAHETRIECSPGEQASLLRDVINRSFPDLEFEASPATEVAGPAEDESRRERRHPLIWSGAVHHDYQTTPVRLRNISSTGALIECEAPLRVGSEPLLDLGEAGTVFATVSWTVGDQAGLKFHTSFDLTQLARTKPDVAHWNAPAYLAPNGQPESASAEQWGRMSLGELRDELEGFLKH